MSRPPLSDDHDGTRNGFGFQIHVARLSADVR